MAVKLNRDVKQGDTFQPVFTYRNKGSKVPVNLLNAVVSGEISRGDLVLPLTPNMIDPVAGKYSLSLSSAQTSTLPVGKYSLVTRITWADGTIKTLTEGQLVVTP